MVIDESALGVLELAQQDCAGILQPLDGGRIEIGHMAGVDRHPGRRDDAGGVEDVLHRNRNAVQRPAITALRNFSFRPTRLRGGISAVTVA